MRQRDGYQVLERSCDFCVFIDSSKLFNDFGMFALADAFFSQLAVEAWHKFSGCRAGGACAERWDCQ